MSRQKFIPATRPLKIFPVATTGANTLATAKPFPENCCHDVHKIDRYCIIKMNLYDTAEIKCKALHPYYRQLAPITHYQPKRY